MSALELTRISNTVGLPSYDEEQLRRDDDHTTMSIPWHLQSERRVLPWEDVNIRKAGMEPGWGKKHGEPLGAAVLHEVPQWSKEVKRSQVPLPELVGGIQHTPELQESPPLELFKTRLDEVLCSLL